MRTVFCPETTRLTSCFVSIFCCIVPTETMNKKQCSRQLQCEVPCGVGYVVNSSLFINSSLSSLSPTPVMLSTGEGVSCL